MPNLTIPLTIRPGSVASVRHPVYTKHIEDWIKYRLAYEAGDDFKRAYLVKLSKRETEQDFADRMKTSYVPSHAAAAINDIKNAIFQRTADVSRVGGAASYQKAVTGLMGGVDLDNSDMGTFIGTEIIAELLILSRVGILVDNFTSDELGVTLKDRGTKHPFLTMYTAENILSWHKTEDGLQSILLQEAVETTDENGLPNGVELRYRLMQKINGQVKVTFFNEQSKPIQDFVLDVKDIPFTILEIPLSLMRNIADYQIALLNLESSDIVFLIKANYPFYYEFYNSKAEGVHNKGPAHRNKDGEKSENVSASKEISVGTAQGRRFPEGVNPPGFIAPPAETLKAAMDKEAQIKKDIRSLLNLNLQELDPRRQSAESKQKDQGGLENNLSYIGLVLQRGEQSVAEHWSMFEKSGFNVQVTYPKTYSLKSESQRREDAKELEGISDKVPSDTFRREVKKKVARAIIGSHVVDSVMSTIEAEIDAAPTLTADPNIVLSAQKAGLVDDVTASDALGFDGEETVPKAQEDRAKRIELAMEAQGGMENADGARGVPELDKGQASEKEGKEKRGQADKTDLGSEQK